MFWKSQFLLVGLILINAGCTIQAELLGLSSTLPPTPSLTSPNLTGDPSAKFIITDCTAVSMIYIGPAPVPDEGELGWAPCRTGEVEVPLLEGSNELEVWYLPDNKKSVPIKAGELSVRKDTTPPLVSVIQPVANAVFRPGDTLPLQWATIDPSLDNSTAQIDYSCDNGLNWSQIQEASPNLGQFNWTATNENSSQCLMRVSVTDDLGNITRQISDPFQIDSSVTPVSIILGPDFTGKVFPLEKILTVTYEVSGEHLKSNSADAEISFDGGVSWQSVATSLPLSGTFNYQVPSNGSYESVFFRMQAKNIILENGFGNSSAFKINTYGPLKLVTDDVTNISLASFSLESCAGLSKVYLGTDPAPALSHPGWKTCAGNLNVSLNNGNNKIYGRYLNLAGDEFARGEFNIVFDTTAPALSVLSPETTQNLIGGDSSELFWSYSDTNPIITAEAEISISLDNKLNWLSLGENIFPEDSLIFEVPPQESTEAYIRIRAPDQAGNMGETIQGPYNIVLDSSVPVITVSDTLGATPRASGSTLSFNYSTSGSFTEPDSARIEVSYDGGASYTTLATGQPLSGTFNFTSDPTQESSKARFRISVTNSVPKTGRGYSSDFILDANPPQISSLQVNQDEPYARTPFISINALIVDVSGTSLAIEEVPVAASCNSSPQASTVWRAWESQSTALTFELSPVDGPKKICVWAQDALGRMTSGVARTITLETVNVPLLTAFSVVNDISLETSALAGETLRIQWTAQDTEGLHAQPLSISYTTDGNIWKDIVTDQDVTDVQKITWLGSFSENPTVITDSYTNFKAPSSSFFRIRARVRDRAGNTSIAATSDTFNTSNWSIYAGTKDTGDGGVGKSAAIGQTSFDFFAIHPKTGDFYFVTPEGIKKIDVRTGLVSTVVKGSSDLLAPDWNQDSISVDDPQFLLRPSNIYAIEFDSKSRLIFSYLLKFDNQVLDRGIIFELDLETRVVKRLIGGGSSLAEGSSPLQSLIVASGFGIDESDSIYLPTHCNQPVLTRNQAKKFLKFARRSDGSLANSAVFLGGACVFANPTPGTLAKNAPGTINSWPSYLSISPIENGKYIYINGYGISAFKIINGYVRSVNFPNGSAGSHYVKYNRHNQKIYIDGLLGSIYEMTPAFAGDGGETSSVFINNTWAPGCQLDNIDRSSVCGRAVYFKFNNQGVMFFSDGTMINQATANRIRYINREDKIQTLVGSLPLSGQGLDKLLIRGNIRSIAYKRNTNHTTLFPEGLYFMDPSATVMGYIDPDTHLMSPHWGDGSFRDTGVTSAGITAITPSTNVSLSLPYGSHNANYLTFDDQGLPWLRGQYALITVTADGFVEYRQAPGTSVVWSTTTSTTARAISMWVDAGSSNVSIVGKEAFFLGGYASAGDTTSPNRVTFMDFTSNLMTTLMDGIAPIANASEPVPDGSLAKDSHLWHECRGKSIDGNCYIQYEPAFGGLNNRLYFSEKNKLRYIDDVFNTSVARVRDLYVAGADDIITNFIFSDDKQMVFYLKNQALHCHNLGAGPAWCDDSNLYPFQTEMGPLRSCGNQLTWKSSTSLLISNCTGEILQYNLPE